MRILYPLAKRYIAGQDLETALRSLDALNHSGYLSTVDILGENTSTADQARAAKQEYLDLLREIESISTTMDLSIKLTQMGLDIDPELCKSNVEEILRAAKHHSARFDMEGSRYTERTVRMCLDLRKSCPSLGQAVQAYLYRTAADVDQLVQNGVSVRLCKGAYKEPPEIAYQSMDDIRENFRKLAFKLLKEGFLPAIATHDEYLIQEVISFAQREKIDKRSFYMEMLYGVRRDLHKFLLDKGYQVRIYVPYGKSWLPYTLRRLAERKENIFFVLKHLFRETMGLRKLH
ncbi:MAG: proline dehydrogenase family protein [Nitrospinae bacterium]|nr:proline dehydrogenase family protein [Nitrospinota bacterium]